MRHPAGLLAVVLGSLFASALPAQVTVYQNQPGMRLQSGAAVRAGAAWAVTLQMGNDNGNASLPSSFRRHWACGIRGLSPAGERLDVSVTNAGYTDIILPVWSLSTDGVTFGPWTRVPTSATPTRSGTTHRFTLQTPPGVVELRLAKYFPYLVADKDALLAAATASPAASVQVLGASRQGRPIELLTLTDPAVPLAQKQRIWIHSGIHPAETTSYFVVEGLVEELLSGSARSRMVLARTVVDVVPMANPDGVMLGNYRTNAASVNLENEWAAPYNSTEPEITALRTAIEQRMALTSPATIDVLLNLHSSHGLTWPFHFEHVANPSFDITSNRSGVIPEVNALERAWIQAFRSASPFVNRGTTQSSTAGSPTRPFVESMVHDRYAIQSAWRQLHTPAMAITFEGTYGPGPTSAWNTPSDWRQVGREMVAALADHLGIVPGGAVRSDLRYCGYTLLDVDFAPGASRVDFDLTASPGDPLAALVLGVSTTSIPLPASVCALRTDPLIAVGTSLGAGGTARISVTPPPGFVELRAQFVVQPGTGTAIRSSNTLDVLTLR
ncbi:MAG: M14 family zinc carboxypeptidase [Planctomycetota bacterium]